MAPADRVYRTYFLNNRGDEAFLNNRGDEALGST